MKIYILILLYLSISGQVFSQDDDRVLNMQVVATKTPKRISDTAANVTVITAEDLKATGATSVNEILREKGIMAFDNTSSRKSGDSIFIQGLDSEKILIIIDGQRVRSGAMGGITAIKRLPLSSIERIEIVKGPSSFLWGSDAMAGVIYIETKKGSSQDGFHGNVGVAYKNNFYLDDNNHFARPYANTSYTKGPLSLWLGGSYEYGNTWVSPYTIYTVPGFPEEYKIKNDRDEYDNFDIHAGTKIDFLDIHSFEISGSYQQEKSPLEGSTIETNRFNKATVNLKYKVYPNESVDLSLNTGVSYDSEERTSHSQDLEDYYIFSNNELFGVFYINEIFTLKGGYNFELEFFNEKHNEKLYNQQNHAIFFGGDAKIRSVVDFDITLGARYQINIRDASGFSDGTLLHSISPELGVVFKPVNNLAIKAHVGHAFKAPSLTTAFRDYFNHTWFYVGPNPDLKPESSWGYSGTIEYIPVEQLALSVGVFRNDLKNLIAYSDENKEYYNSLPLETPINIGRAYTWGITSTADGATEIIYFGTLSYNVNFEMLWTKELLTEENKYISPSGERFDPHLQNRPGYTVSGSLEWNKREWGTSLKFSGYYFGQGYEYEEIEEGVYQENRTDPQTTFDIRLAQKILPQNNESKVETIVFFEVKNVLNAIYDDDGDGDIDRPERHFVVGFDLTF